MLIFDTNLNVVHSFERFLTSQFDMKDMGVKHEKDAFFLKNGNTVICHCITGLKPENF